MPSSQDRSPAVHPGRVPGESPQWRRPPREPLSPPCGTGRARRTWRASSSAASRTTGAGDWGLSDAGRGQVLAAALALRPAARHGDLLVELLPRPADGCSSVRAQLGASEVITAGALRERFFGEWKAPLPSPTTRGVWAADEADARAGPTMAPSPRPPCSTGRPRSSRTRSGGTPGGTSCWCPTGTRCRSCRRASCAPTRRATGRCRTWTPRKSGRLSIREQVRPSG